MVGWHHRVNGHELEQIAEDSDEQGNLVRTFHEVARSWT